MSGASELVKQLEIKFGLDRPIHEQFFLYLINAFQGNLGYSIELFPKTVSELVMRALPWTIALLLTTLVFSWVIGNVLGVVAGWLGTRSKLSIILSSACILLGNIPYYVFALLLVFFFTFIPILPTSFSMIRTGSLIEAVLNINILITIIVHSILPSISIILVSLSGWFFSIRALTASLKEEEFIKFAVVEGLSRRTIVYKYLLRNALLPQITWLAISIGNIAGGSLLTEIIFAYPGTGYLLYNAIKGMDYPVIQGIMLIVIVGVCIAVFVVELLNPLIDPRIRR
jgi:peptide/nickel transport system permease protein